ncbi:hypothetical protein H1C71_008975 [Ictidomys tridecemlineatus]|nr:hypothetical protein H1C71_008975 [Ictidomys tridecemlineatus]
MVQLVAVLVAATCEPGLELGSGLSEMNELRPGSQGAPGRVGEAQNGTGWPRSQGRGTQAWQHCRGNEASELSSFPLADGGGRAGQREPGPGAPGRAVGSLTKGLWQLRSSESRDRGRPRGKPECSGGFNRRPGRGGPHRWCAETPGLLSVWNGARAGFGFLGDPGLTKSP